MSTTYIFILVHKQKIYWHIYMMIHACIMCPDTVLDVQRIKAELARLGVNDTCTFSADTTIYIHVLSMNCIDRAHEDFIVY
jgi:hypothetical protein